MLTITNKALNYPSILINIDDDYQIIFEKLWCFTHENFLFTLEITFMDYDPNIIYNNEKYYIFIKKKYLLGDIMKTFYEKMYKNWLYY